MYNSEVHLKGSVEKGDNRFDNLKRSKVNKEFLLPCKTTRLNFNSTQFQLLNFSLESLFDNENALLTFDLLGSLKTVIALLKYSTKPLICFMLLTLPHYMKSVSVILQ